MAGSGTCLGAKVAAEVVRRFSPRSLPHVLPAAALMHDVGELVLSHHLSSATLNDLDAARTVGMSVVEAERRVLDIDHAEVSAIICRLWRFPDVIADGVRHHHAPWTSGDALSYAVALCDVIADVALGGSNRDVVDSLTVSRCLVELDISKVDFGGLVEHTTERLAKYGKQFV